MIVTEAEAARMSCVHWAFVDHERWTDNCLSTKCMAWRWHWGMKQVAPPSECPDCKGKGVLIDPVNDALPGCSTCDGSGKVGHFEKAGYCGFIDRGFHDAKL